MIKKLINVNNDLTKKIENLKKKGKKIVLCHGSFDLVHPGHIEHLSEAKMLGDILIVSITAVSVIAGTLANWLACENKPTWFALNCAPMIIWWIFLNIVSIRLAANNFDPKPNK